MSSPSYRRQAESYVLGDPDYRSEADETDYADVSDRLDHIDTKIDDKIDETIGEIFDLRGRVEAVSTTNITLSGEQTLDGVNLASGDLILVSGQTDSADNGIYVVSENEWARWPEADEDGEVTVGATVHVFNNDSLHNGQFWLLLNNEVEVGVDGQSWVPLTVLAPIFVVILQGLITYFKFGSGSPNGAQTAPMGAMYLNSDGGSSQTLWIKESGTGNTGWHAVTTT